MKLLLANCDILASENGRFRLLKNGFLGVDGSRICFLGETRPEGPWDREKDMSGRLLIPGLVNCHGHTPMTLLRGVGSDLPLHEWLFGRVMPVEDRLTDGDLRTGNNLALLEMIACGTTSYSDMYFGQRLAAENTAAAGIRANLCRPVQSFDEAERYEDSRRARESLEFFREWNGAADGRIRVDFCIHAEYTCTERVTRAYAEDCKALGGRMQLHLSETAREQEECLARRGMTPAAWFSSLGVFDSPAAAAHCVRLTPEDVEILREKNVSVVHCPTSNLKLASGFAPVPELLEKGINVALGTDGAASNNNLNLLEEMHLAAVIHNGFTGDPLVMKPETVLRMATENGAKLQGRDDTGSLEVGKKADLAAVDLDRPHLTPNLDPPALLVYSAQASDVCMTMADGKILYENGEFLTLDREKILAEARAAAKRLYV